jgi:TorA maturation chaperone TorD
MAINEEIQIVLESRAYNYLLFQSIFGNEPTRELIETIGEEATRQSFELFVVDGKSPYSSALLAVAAAMDALKGCSQEAVEDLRDEYTRLYLGPAELKAPPWESMYVSKKRQLFEENTLKVRNFYRAQGFLPAEYPRVADDHIALECAFMAQLGERAKNSSNTGDTKTVKAALEASRRFLDEHLLVWLPGYIADMSRIGRADFYPLITQLALGYVQVDRRIIDELVSDL